MAEHITFQVSLPKRAYQSLKRIAKKKQKSESDILLDALRAYLEQLAKVDPFLGMFADETELIDNVVIHAMQAREHTPLRIHEGK